MAQQITKHSKERIIERNENVDYFVEAEKLAKIAYKSGLTINHFQKYPKTMRYLQAKRNQTNSCRIRIYKNNIYIWRGKGILVTAHPFPTYCLKEMEELG